MNELIEASLQAPTVIFTIGLGIALVYWVFVLLGALDLDLLGSAKGIEGLKGIKVDVDGDGVWSGLGLGKVPVTISASLVLLVGWCSSVWLQSWLGWIVLPVALLAALIVTALLVRPLAPVFAIREGKTNRDYVGTTCIVSTGRVDEGFGQATLEDGGTVLQIPVRCDRSGLARGDRALIIDFDDRRQAYLVEPAREVIPQDQPEED